MPNGKLRRRANGASSSSSSNPAPIKRGCERRRTSTTMVFEVFHIPCLKSEIFFKGISVFFLFGSMS